MPEKDSPNIMQKAINVVVNRDSITKSPVTKLHFSKAVKYKTFCGGLISLFIWMYILKLAYDSWMDIMYYRTPFKETNVLSHHDEDEHGFNYKEYKG